MNRPQGQIFWITPSPADKVHLDQNRQGTVACTVTSTRGPIRARAIIVPQGSARAEWFKLEGPAERFIDGTEQFTVKISVPAGTKAGDYSFLLKVVSEANPDDEFTDGPWVAFEVPASEPLKKFPWWIVIVVVGALLLVGGAVLAYVLMSGDPQLGEECDETCAEGLVCATEEGDEEGICVGDMGFDECSENEDCAAGLTCAIEEGEETGMCLGGLGFGGCDPEAEEGQCGTGLVCEDGTCKGGIDFAGCSPENCATGLLCRDSTCVDPVGQICTADPDCGPGLQCLQVGTDRVCLRSVGQACVDRFECVSQACTNGQCVTLPNGAPCTNSSMCESNNCQNSRCAPPPIPCVPPCPLFMRCSGGMCVPRVLEPVPGFQEWRMRRQP